MSKGLLFIRFRLFVLFLQGNHICVMTCISVNVNFLNLIREYRKNENEFNLKEEIISRKKQNIDFKHFALSVHGDCA